MSSLLSPEEMSEYEGVIKDAMDTFGQKEIIWMRTVSSLDRFGEDAETPPQPITLKALCNYNVYRTWPITQISESGAIDKQSVQLFFLKQDLAELGYLNATGYMDYESMHDRFIIDGLPHIAYGDTPAAQLSTSDLFFTLIVKREELPTGQKR